MYIYIYIYINIYIFTFLYEVHTFHTLTVLSAFVVYYMCDGSIASIASPIISLVTGKSEYEINALYLCPPLPLSKYIQWRTMKRGEGGCEECGRILHPLPLFRTVSNLC